MISVNEQSRINWVEQKLKELPSGTELLDAGAGEQQYKKFCTHLNYTSQDFGEYDPKAKILGLQLDNWNYGKLDIISDIVSIPRPDASFDAVLCTEVFEHIPDPIQALKEFFRLLKPGGVLILTAPFCSMTHFAPYHYSSGFSRYYYEYHLPRIGFQIKELTPNGNYFSVMLQEVIRIPYVAANYGIRKPKMHEKWALKVIRKMLDSFISSDNISSELMCFGWHVVAEKKSK